MSTRLPDGVRSRLGGSWPGDVTAAHALLCFLALAGCGSSPTRAPHPASAESRVLGSEDHVWSKEIVLDEVTFTFEIDPEEDLALDVLPERHALAVGMREVSSRGGAFFVGQRWPRRVPLEPGSRVRVYRAAAEGEEWVLRRPNGLEIRWAGSGHFFAMEEENPRFGLRWHCHRGMVWEEPDGRVSYHSRSRESRQMERREIALPSVVRLDSLGSLVEGTSPP